MTSAQGFAGLNRRECGDHRTAGYRAWCFDDSEWCSPTIPCRGCELPDLRTERDEARAEVEQWRATFGETALRDARNILAERDRLAAQAERHRAGVVRLAQAWARHGKGALAAELLTEFEMDENEILGEAGS